jgi:subtilisin-like proprotein convertase family protein
MQRTARGLIAVSLVVAGLGTASTASAAGPICPVTNGPELTTALADAGCTTINLAAGTYSSATSPAFSVGHSVSIVGAGSDQTTLTTTGSGNVFVFGGGTLDLSGVTVTGATSGSGLVLSAATTTHVSNSVIADNASGTLNGAGISFSGATLTVTDSEISGNTDNNNSGGGGSNNSGGTATFDRVLFVNNESHGIGGAGGWNNHVTGDVANFTNVTFTGNNANNDGGALRNGSSSTANLTNVTIAGNTANADNTGGGIGGGVVNEGSTFNVTDSIIAGNFFGAGGSSRDCASSAPDPVTRLGYVLVGDATGCAFGGAGDTATGYQTGVDPKLSDLANSGGFTGSVAPIPGSPAIDKIPAASCGAAVDQRSVARPQNGLCDLGAVEREFFAPFPFRNPGQITINDNAAASPYPSQITVGGLPGTITDLTVRLDGLAHTYADDIDVLLVGPRGQVAMLMSGAGGSSDTSGGTIDFNSAGLALPNDDPLLSRTYAPAAFGPGLTTGLPAPAPAAPYTASLAPFLGTDPNGTWNLYVDDNEGGDEGEIVNGWALNIKTPPAAPPATTKKKCKKGYKLVKKHGKKKCKKKKKRKK